jgi:hypothetical protein
MHQSPASPQPWYTSRGLWTGIGLVVSNLLVLFGAAGVIHLTPELTTAVVATWNSILGLAAIVFRWQAQAPLATKRKMREFVAPVLLLFLVFSAAAYAEKQPNARRECIGRELAAAERAGGSTADYDAALYRCLAERQAAPPRSPAGAVTKRAGLAATAEVQRYQGSIDEVGYHPPANVWITWSLGWSNPEFPAVRKRLTPAVAYTRGDDASYFGRYAEGDANGVRGKAMVPCRDHDACGMAAVILHDLMSRWPTEQETKDFAVSNFAEPATCADGIGILGYPICDEPPPPPPCGDGRCSAGGGEDCMSCPADCGACPPEPPVPPDDSSEGGCLEVVEGRPFVPSRDSAGRLNLCLRPLP